MRFGRLLALPLLAALAGLSLAQDQPPGQKPFVLLELEGLRGQELAKALEDMFAVHRWIRSQGEARFQTATGEDKSLVAFVLGCMRDDSAVPVLLDAIDFKGAPQPGIRMPLWSRHPAVDALQRIGSASVAHIMHRAPTEGGDERLGLMMEVVHRVMQFAPGKALLTEAIEKEKVPARRERLEKALALFLDIQWCQEHPLEALKRAEEEAKKEAVPKSALRGKP